MQHSSLISAVVTTGIYCREGCQGRPKRENVVEFSSPVAAEAAGFRACLRCRPYRLAPANPPDEAPEVVSHALLLIGEGVLEEEREEDLARRVGISARQLRRLFRWHVGATPTFVARSRSAHFARRLLDETDLPVTEIAFGAGFSTVRQMNRAMRETFRATPSELRARRFRADRLVADGGLPLRMPYHGPLAFADTLEFLSPRAIPGVETVDSDSYRRTITSCGNAGVIEVSDACDGSHLVLTAHLPTFDSLIDDVARARRVFGLDQPTGLWLRPLVEDPLTAPLVVARPGLRAPGAWDRFEVGVRIILGQGISVAAASTLAGRLVHRFGREAPGLAAMGLTHIFPPADRLAGAKASDLGEIGLPVARAEAIRAFADAYVSEKISLDPGGQLERLVESLVALPGIGSWTAHFIALRAAGQLDAFPAEDLGLRHAIGRLLGRPQGDLIAARELESQAKAWRPYRGVAAMHLWASLAGAAIAGTGRSRARGG